MSTTSAVSTFTFDGSDVRSVLDTSGEPWFVAMDVCAILGTATNHVREYLDEDEVRNLRNTDIGAISTENGGRAPLLVSEAGLYALIVRSRKPIAKPFRRWVTHEVLPSIRRRGLYATSEVVEAMLGDPEVMIRLLTEIKTERERSQRLAAQVEADRPKVVFADAVAASEDVILVGDLAKLLRQNGIQVGAVRLFAWLRGNGWLIARRGTDWNMPTQRAMELGLFEVSELAITHSDGRVSIKRTTKVTGKGQRFFVERFVDGRFNLAA